MTTTYGRWMVGAVLALAGCAGEFDAGWEDGCDDATEQGYQWGYEDAEGCWEADPTVPPGNSGSDDYSAGYDAGYAYCYGDAYDEGYTEALAYLGDCT